jgi:hypothetical protein
MERLFYLQFINVFQSRIANQITFVATCTQRSSHCPLEIIQQNENQVDCFSRVSLQPFTLCKMKCPGVVLW